MTDQVRRGESDPAPPGAAAAPPAAGRAPAGSPTDDASWTPPDPPATATPGGSTGQPGRPARPVRPVVPVVRRNPGQTGQIGHAGQPVRSAPPVRPWAQQPPRPPSVRAVPAGWRVVPLPPAGQPGYGGQPGQPTNGWPAHPNGARANGVTHANGWPRSGQVDPWQRFVSSGRPVYREPYPIRAKAFLAGLGATVVWFGMFAAVSWSARSYAWTALVAGVLATLAAVALARFGDRGVAVGVTIATTIGVTIAGIVVTAYGFGGTWLFW